MEIEMLLLVFSGLNPKDVSQAAWLNTSKTPGYRVTPGARGQSVCIKLGEESGIPYNAFLLSFMFPWQTILTNGNLMKEMVCWLTTSACSPSLRENQDRSSKQGVVTDILNHEQKEMNALVMPTWLVLLSQLFSLIVQGIKLGNGSTHNWTEFFYIN